MEDAAERGQSREKGSEVEGGNEGEKLRWQTVSPETRENELFFQQKFIYCVVLKINSVNKSLTTKFLCLFCSSEGI